MAAKAAASVVWLTVDTAPTTGLISALAAVFAGLVTGFDSDFLFVTEAFDCTGAAFAVTLDKGFAFDGVAAALVPALGIAFGAILEDFSAVTLGFAALALPAAVFFGAGLAAAGFAFFAEGVRVFADFVIALAMESTITTWLLLPRTASCARETDLCAFQWLASARAIFSDSILFRSFSSAKCNSLPDGIPPKTLNQKLLIIA